MIDLNFPWHGVKMGGLVYEKVNILPVIILLQETTLSALSVVKKAIHKKFENLFHIGS